jgi:hypothetical protein
LVQNYTLKPTLSELLTKGKLLCLKGEHFRPVKNISFIIMGLPTTVTSETVTSETATSKTGGQPEN